MSPTCLSFSRVQNPVDLRVPTVRIGHHVFGGQFGGDGVASRTGGDAKIVAHQVPQPAKRVLETVPLRNVDAVSQRVEEIIESHVVGSHLGAASVGSNASR